MVGISSCNFAKISVANKRINCPIYLTVNFVLRPKCTWVSNIMLLTFRPVLGSVVKTLGWDTFHTDVLSGILPQF